MDISRYIIPKKPIGVKTVQDRAGIQFCRFTRFLIKLRQNLFCLANKKFRIGKTVPFCISLGIFNGIQTDIAVRVGRRIMTRQERVALIWILQKCAVMRFI